ncbi:MAG: LLM class flavin-dependent oxidoreductase [Rhodobacteraceae bacterium]|nr:LLM class flavin-dependent oxidoreductase [Paracoccaceae bacterium]
MSSFSSVLIGNESLLIGCGDALRDRGHSISAVVSQDPEIRNWAEKHGIQLLDRIAQVSDCAGFDWLFSIANLSIIPDAILALPQRGAINFHDGPLPLRAGLNAPVWALINRDTDYGVTWHMLEGGVDEGDIVEQRLFEISEGETAFSLNSKCYAAAMESFSSVIAQLENGAPAREPQDLSLRSYHARDDRPAAAGRMDFRKSTADLLALINALNFGEYWNPLSCAKIVLGDEVVLVRQATAALGSGEPGTILEGTGDSLTVCTSDGAIRLGTLQTAYGHPFDLSNRAQVGQVLATPDAQEAAELEHALAQVLASEARQRKAVRAMNPLAVPLALPTHDTGVIQRDVALPAGLAQADQVALALAWALKSTGEDHGSIALSTLDTLAQAWPGIVTGWQPMTTGRDEAFSAVCDRMVDALPKARGFACDLPARDPGIADFRVPQIHVVIGQEGLAPSSVLTLCLLPGTTRLYADASQVSGEVLELLTKRLEHLAGAAVADREAPLKSLPILPAAERAQMLTDWNSTTLDHDRTLTIPVAFEAQVDKTPDATALVFEDQELSYAQLDARANALADSLRALGADRGSHVGVYLARSTDLVAATLAILKTGAAYVPLDPAYPADRVAHYIADSCAQIIISDGTLAGELPAHSAKVLDVTTVAPAADRAACPARPEDLAYLIYTSGSTGTPKGVMVRHDNVTNFFAAMDERIPHQPGDAWLAVTSLSFDISVLELFWTLSRGFKLVLSSDESRLVMSNGPLQVSDRRMDFNLFFWGNDDGPGPRKYHLLLEGAKFADAHGFNAVWTPERHFHAFGGPYPNPSVTGAAVAAVTQNLSVRAGSCVAPLHHPARIAEEWSVIDNLTNGRTGLGIASGWQPDDFILRPENTPPANKPAMYEAIETLRRLWRGEAMEFPRQDGTMHSVVTQPRPVSKELGIWVTTAGNPQTWKEAGEIGANVLTHLLGQSIDEVAGKIRIYHEALLENGHNPDDFKVTLMLHTYLADTREEAREIAREPMREYLRSAAGLIKQFAWVFPAFKKPKGVNNPFEMDLGILSEEELEAILDFAFDRYFEDSGLFGTVADGVARVEELKRIGVDEVACLIDYGITPEQVMEGLKPLAEVLRIANAPSQLAEDDFSLAAQIIRHDISHMQCTPSMARMITADDEARMALGHLKHMLVGGEALPGDLVAELHACGNAQIHNMYGPTETTIWSTMQTLANAPSSVASIGGPIANTQVYVLDDDGQPCPVGVPGELFIAGEGVTSGYWQRADLTGERFPEDLQGNGRMYRTGDLVRWRADGQLDFLGRTDHQVKIRGQRIELGEIEAAMASFQGVTGAVVIPHEKTAGDVRLVGYFTSDALVDPSALKQHLSTRLTETMVPSAVMALEQFPLTPNKKIDRKALPEPQAQRVDVPTAGAAPVEGTAARIAAVWEKILGLSGVGAQDNFFVLGGHSLLAVQAHREIRETLDVAKLSITDIFRFPVLSALAAHIDKLSGGASPEPTGPAPVDTAARSETMSKRRAMRAGRRTKAG